MWASIAALFGGGLLKMFTFETLKYLAFRAFIIALCLGLGPVVIFWGYTYILQHLLEYVATFIGGEGLDSPTFSVVGLGGWVVSSLRVGEALSIYLSLILLSFSLRMIRAK